MLYFHDKNEHSILRLHTVTPYGNIRNVQEVTFINLCSLQKQIVQCLIWYAGNVRMRLFLTLWTLDWNIGIEKRCTFAFAFINLFQQRGLSSSLESTRLSSVQNLTSLVAKDCMFCSLLALIGTVIIYISHVCLNIRLYCQYGHATLRKTRWTAIAESVILGQLDCRDFQLWNHSDPSHKAKSESFSAGLNITGPIPLVWGRTGGSNGQGLV